MEYETKLTKLGGSKTLILPPMFLKHIGYENDENVIIKDDVGKHGNFISIWVKNDDNSETTQ